MKLSDRLGFTLIELLVVIAVLGALSTGVVVVLNPNKRINDAKLAVINTNFAKMQYDIEAARTLKGAVLGVVTGSFCTDCTFCRSGDVRSVNCVNSMNTAWQRVTGKNMILDPYGNPYLIDENDGEGGGFNKDILRSAGPDHLFGTSDDRTYYPSNYSN